MQVDIDKTNQVVDGANKVFLTPQAEQTLIELLALREKIDAAIVQAEVSAEKILETLKTHKESK